MAVIDMADLMGEDTGDLLQIMSGVLLDRRAVDSEYMHLNCTG